LQCNGEKLKIFLGIIPKFFFMLMSTSFVVIGIVCATWVAWKIWLPLPTYVKIEQIDKVIELDHVDIWACQKFEMTPSQFQQ
jgi:hypothetical protein